MEGILANLRFLTLFSLFILLVGCQVESVPEATQIAVSDTDSFEATAVPPTSPPPTPELQPTDTLEPTLTNTPQPTATNTPEPTPTATNIPFKNIRYGGGQSLNIYLPNDEEAPYPTVIVYSLSFSEAPAAVGDSDRIIGENLADKGYAVITVRTGENLNALSNAVCALAWSHTQAGIYGFDTEQMVAMGINWAGSMAATVAMADDLTVFMSPNCNYQQQLPASNWVRGAVNFMGYMAARIPEPIGTQVNHREMLKSFCGLSTAQSEEMWANLNSVDPVEWQNIDSFDNEIQNCIATFPLYWLDENDPPILFVNPKSSEFLYQADSFTTDLLALGVEAESVELEGGDRYFRDDADGIPFLREAMSAFDRALKRVLAATAE
ncbi:MAG: hypothetical protein DWQ04_12810 [Chloroflexi bacterium]|nr:MAG: hypothetical protein DWQ04_12810 [Chloroflexota bacterium]